MLVSMQGRERIERRLFHARNTIKEQMKMKGYTILKLTIIFSHLVVMTKGGNDISFHVDGGTAFTFYCQKQGVHFRGSIIWSLTISRRTKTVASCYLSTQCSDNYPSYFNASIKAEMGYTVSGLTIHSFNSSMTSLVCTINTLYQSWEIAKWTLYIYTPLRLQAFVERNSTKYHTPMKSLAYFIVGYPPPIKNSSKLLILVRNEPPLWANSSDFLISWEEYNMANRPPEYKHCLILTRSALWRNNTYMVEVTNGMAPSLKIFFTTTTTATSAMTSTSTQYPTRTTSQRQSDTSSMSMSKSSIWILAPALGCSIPLVIVLFVLIYCCRNRKARARGHEHSSSPTARPNTSASALSGAPLISRAQMLRDPLQLVAGRGSSNSSLPHNQQQLEAPPSYEVATLNNCNHSSVSVLDAHALPDISYSSMQCAVTLPAYDTVSKPEDPPPPYTSIQK